MITQRIDKEDSVLGFFHEWLKKFAEKLDKLYVACLVKNGYDLPENVKVFSLGKEKGFSKIRQFFRLQKFLMKHLSDVDGIFIHMCSIYVLAIFPLAKIFRKKIILWHVHKSVGWKLKLAEKCADQILTASPESCRLKNRKKIKVVGHGIDTDFFKPLSLDVELGVSSGDFRIICPGRISPIKDQEILIKAVNILVNQKNIKDIAIKIIGAPIDEYEKEYAKKIEKLVQILGLGERVSFFGAISHNRILEHYQNSDLMINLSHTGSIDKVVLEAMSSGCLVLTCNEAFYGILDKRYLFKKKNPQDLAEKILYFKKINLEARKQITQHLREQVIESHNLDNLIDKIILNFK